MPGNIGSGVFRDEAWCHLERHQPVPPSVPGRCSSFFAFDVKKREREREKERARYSVTHDLMLRAQHGINLKKKQKRERRPALARAG